MLETIKAEFLDADSWKKTTPLGRKTVRSWMNSHNIEILGATHRLLFDKEHWPRVTPALSLYETIGFRQKYYGRCLRESEKRDTDWQWVDEGWDLTHSIVYWIGDLLRDESIDPTMQVEPMSWLKQMLLNGYRRDLLAVAVFDHLLSDRKIAGHFVLWKDDPRLSWIFDLGK